MGKIAPIPPREWIGALAQNNFCQITVFPDVRKCTFGHVRLIITKTRLFKYIENFTSKTENFQIKILIFF